MGDTPVAITETQLHSMQLSIDDLNAQTPNQGNS